MPRGSAAASADLASIQVIDSMNVQVGGPAYSVSRLASALQRTGMHSTIATLDYPERGPIPATPGTNVHSVRAGFLARHAAGYNLALSRLIASLVGGSRTIIHTHGLWRFANLYSAQAAARTGARLVVSPRGMLEEWSLRRGRIKKKMVWHAWERRNLGNAAFIHATSEAEAAACRSLGLSQPIAVIPNGIDIPDTGDHAQRSVLETRFPELTGKRWLLFLSRLHPKKGVVELVDAWARVRGVGSGGDCHLLIAGQDLEGYRSTVEQRVDAKGVRQSVTLAGMLTEEAKASALANCDVLVLPTHSENFGVAIAEALAYGRPVITTKAAPWPAIASERCGWWIDAGEEALVAALTQAIAAPAAQLDDMGRRGRAHVASRYDWDHVALQMKAAYLWAVRGGVLPDCMRLT